MIHHLDYTEDDAVPKPKKTQEKEDRERDERKNGTGSKAKR